MNEFKVIYKNNLLILNLFFILLHFFFSYNFSPFFFPSHFSQIFKEPNKAKMLWDKWMQSP